MVINKSYLEVFVESYVKTLKRNTVGSRFVQKALALIDQKFGSPCCDDPSGVLELYTPRENDLTIFVRTFLAQTPKKGNVQSLNRVKRKLERFLNCCRPPTAPTNGVVQGTLYPYSFDFDFVPGYENINDYEYTIDSGATYKPITEKPVQGESNDITNDRAIGTVGVRIKSRYGSPAGLTLYNSTAFLD